MSRLVEAYDASTGKKLPDLVPAMWVGHPTFGPHLYLTPRAKKAGATVATEPPASGDKKEK